MPDEVTEEETVVDIEGDPILESGLKRALEDLVSNNTEEIHNILSEFLTSSGEVPTNRVITLVCIIYETGDVPSDFLKNIIYTILR